MELTSRKASIQDLNEIHQVFQDSILRAGAKDHAQDQVKGVDVCYRQYRPMDGSTCWSILLGSGIRSRDRRVRIIKGRRLHRLSVCAW